MKKAILAAALAILLVCSFTLGAFATESFTPSVSGEETPTIRYGGSGNDYDEEDEDFVEFLEKFDLVLGDDGQLHPAGYVPGAAGGSAGEGGGMLVIYDKEDKPVYAVPDTEFAIHGVSGIPAMEDKEKQELFQTAYDQLKDAKSLAELEAGLDVTLYEMGLGEMPEALRAELEAEAAAAAKPGEEPAPIETVEPVDPENMLTEDDLVARDVMFFDLKDGSLDFFDGTEFTYVKLTFDLKVEKDADVLFMVYTADDITTYEPPEEETTEETTAETAAETATEETTTEEVPPEPVWKAFHAVDVTNNGDGTVTVRLRATGPIAVVVRAPQTEPAA